MIQSMTGYGYHEYNDGRYSITCEIKGYNNRYLDMQIALPGTLGAIENDLRGRIKENISRGRVEIYIRLQSFEESPEVRVDHSQARALADALRELKSAAGVSGKITVDQLIGFEGLIRLEKNRDPEAVKPMVLECFEQSFERFVESRIREGESTVADILGQLVRFETGFGDIKNREGEIEIFINRQLRTRFEEVLGDRIEEERILSELASLLVKHSINEELSRLSAHIAQFRSELSAGGTVGKRLDFLCQEMNRETNTIGSKNLLVEISGQVIEMKDALENIREQLRNIE